jgi:hypothetical protein
VKPRRREDAWPRSSERAELMALYAEADSLLEGWSCACSGSLGDAPPAGSHCCHFTVIGREPYPTAIELEEVRFAIRAAPPARPRATDARRALPLADLRPCPLLSTGGRCAIYASRPFGCRTFFCDAAEAPFGAKEKLPRAALHRIGRRIADLSARFAPHDPHPRPLVRALVGAGRKAHNC